ncbi:MAG: ubiquitin-like domain-containing protein [Candidatus Saccharimonadaceae bacterium]
MIFSTKSAEAQSEGGRLITVHDRGTEKAFVTTKETLKDALIEQGIKLDAKDAVEPSVDEKLVAPDYQVNIYRVRPVTVIDGATRQKIVTPYQSAERIVRDSGITLYPEDTTKLERSDDIVSDGAGLQLTIDRATPMSIDLYGAKTEIRTQGDTIGDMLKEKNIKLGESDMASVSMDTAVVQGMEIRIWREGKQTVNAEEEIAFQTEQIKDADRTVGYKELQAAGIAGKRTVTYEVEIQNGIEVGRVEIASLVTVAPTKQVEVIGTKPKTLPYTGGGSKTDWLAASSIAQENWGYADFLVGKESGWNPNAVNKSSGACGLVQALPCSKLGPSWNNPVVALNWANGYVNRYGGWEGAYNFWLTHYWY